MPFEKKQALAPLPEVPKEDYEKWRALMSWWKEYPDYYYDAMESPDASFTLNFYQRVYLRGIVRFQYSWLDGTRGTTKTYLDTLAKHHRCIFYPGTIETLIAPSKYQSRQLVWEAVIQIEKNYPAIKYEYEIITNSQDEIVIEYYNGSRFRTFVNGAAAQGGNHTNLSIEEESQPNFDITAYTGNVAPGVRLKRFVRGHIDPREKNQRYTHLTNASSQQSFAWQERKNIAQKQYDGGDAIVMGNTWRLPVIFGVRDMEWVSEQRGKMTPLVFEQQMNGFWTGTNSGAIVSDDIISASRRLKLAEFEHCGHDETWYIVAYDVAREEGSDNAKSAMVVIKYTPIPQDERHRHGSAIYFKDVVNIAKFEGTRFDVQAKYLKTMVEKFRAYRLVVDMNGIGRGIGDWLMMDMGDGFPPYGAVNDDRLAELRQPNAVDILFSIKDGAKESPTAEMINVAATEFNNGCVRLLVDEHTGVKEYKRAKRIKDDDDDVRISNPYLYTNLMCEEISNLKQITEGHNTREKRIRKSIQRDTWSALKYGLFVGRMRELEEMVGADQGNEWHTAAQSYLANRRSAHLQNPRAIGGRMGRIAF